MFKSHSVTELLGLEAKIEKRNQVPSNTLTAQILSEIASWPMLFLEKKKQMDRNNFYTTLLENFKKMNSKL